MHKLTLAAKAGAWQMFTGRKADPAFQRFSQKILRRDNYACQFCGFQAKDFQEVVNLDHNYHYNKATNLVTACVFCAQCFFLESVGVGDYGGGTIIYLPELSQASLNSFCHVLFCAVTNDTGYKASAQSLFRSLKFRAQAVEEQFGEGSSHPAVFGQLLIDSAGKYSHAYEDVLNNLRLLPARGGFKMQIERWAETALQELSAEL